MNCQGINNANYKDGRTLKKYYCVDCNKEIVCYTFLFGSKRCGSCSRKGERHPNYGKKFKINPKCIKRGKYHSGWKGGISLKKQKCKDCGKKISCYAKRCQPCASKLKRLGLKHTEESKQKMRETALKQYRENPELAERIRKTLKKLYKRDVKFRQRLKDNSMKAMRMRKVKPNKPEKKLNKLLNRLCSKEYKFVGDGKVIIDRFNPDFININGQKKIIEMYGDYWHNLPENIKRDKKRIKAYTKYGYKTLIVWEHELKDLDKLKTKILNFGI